MARTNTLGNFLTDVADAIRTKKGSQELIAAEDFDTEIKNLPSGSGRVEAPDKDVNFYDYDGFRVYSYTAQEFLALEEMPANPTHEGLTAQGWNWTLSDAKSYVTDYNRLNIGQMYDTSDGTTKIHIELKDGRTSPYVGFGIDGTATIDWGDNSETTTVTGSNTASPVFTQHNYSEPGKYTISISSETTIRITGSSNGGTYLVKGTNSATVNNDDMYYKNAILSINLSSNADISGNYSFRDCYRLSSVTIPNTISTIGYGCFNNCPFLFSITIPNSITSISEYCFAGCYGLSQLIIPNTMTNIGGYSFQNCYRLSVLTIPNTVTSIGDYAFKLCYCLSYITGLGSLSSVTQGVFQNCYGPIYYDFSTAAAIPTLVNKNAFNGIASDCKIIVPDSLYATWKKASYWSNYASNIISKTDWDALQNA